MIAITTIKTTIIVKIRIKTTIMTIVCVCVHVRPSPDVRPHPYITHTNKISCCQLRMNENTGYTDILGVFDFRFQDIGFKVLGFDPIHFPQYKSISNMYEKISCAFVYP